MSFDSALATFLTEATELLERMEMSLVELARSGSSAELINDIFRAAHTIKGTGGVFGFDTVVEFTHVVENLLDRIRAGHQEITPDMASLLLECCDHMRLLVQAAVEDTALNASEQGTHQQLLAQLQDCMEQPADQSLATTAEQDDDARVTRQPDPDDPRVENDHWHISIRFSPAVLQYGMDPLSFLRYLNRLGQIVDVVTLFDDKVTLAELNPDRKSTRLNSSHVRISYAVFCLKKKKDPIYVSRLSLPPSCLRRTAGLSPPGRVRLPVPHSRTLGPHLCSGPPADGYSPRAQRPV